MRLFASASRPPCADRRSGSRTGSPPGRTGPPAGRGGRPGRDREADVRHRSGSPGSFGIESRPRRRPRRLRRATRRRSPGRRRGSPPRRAARRSTRTRARSTRIELLERELEAEGGAAEVEQDQRRLRARARTSSGWQRRSVARSSRAGRPRFPRPWPPGRRRRRPGRPCRAARLRSASCATQGPDQSMAPPPVVRLDKPMVEPRLSRTKQGTICIRNGAIAGPAAAPFRRLPVTLHAVYTRPIETRPEAARVRSVTFVDRDHRRR